MNRHLPPLNALRAFEAAGRHLSLTQAATELHVTPAAVGQQVKSLEDYLGAKLFVRHNRALSLTPAGKMLLAGLGIGFDQLADAVRQFREFGANKPLTVSANISFCSKWLIPRLERFRAGYPDIDIRVDANNALTDFLDGVDVAVRYGPETHEGLCAFKLWDPQVFPVCSPALLAQGDALCCPQDLANHELLHVEWTKQDEVAMDWRMWLMAADAADVDVSRGPVFNQFSLAIQAAVEGQGVALAYRALVMDDLDKGRLVKPFEVTLEDGFTYYLVYPKSRHEEHKIAVFRDWMLAEVSESTSTDSCI